MKTHRNNLKKVTNQSSLKIFLPLDHSTEVITIEEVTTEVEEVEEDFRIVVEDASFLGEVAEERSQLNPARDGFLKAKLKNSKMIRSKTRKLVIIIIIILLLNIIIINIVNSNIVDNKEAIIRNSIMEVKMASIVSLNTKRKEKIKSSNF